MKPGDLVRVKNMKLYSGRLYLCLDDHVPFWADEGDPPTHMNVLDSGGKILGFPKELLEVVE
jgi:hypothetical protein